MAVLKVGERRVLEAGSVVISDKSQTATIGVANLEYRFSSWASAVPPSANFFVPDERTGTFWFEGILPGQDYFFTFKAIGIVSEQYVDLDVCVRCLAYDRVTTPVFRVDYVFAFQAPPAPPSPPLASAPNALLGGL